MRSLRHRARATLEEVRLLGPRKLAYRLLFELKRRTGLAERLEPIGDERPPLGSIPGCGVWLDSLAQGHWLRRVSDDVSSGSAGGFLRGCLPPQEVTALLARAELARRGTVRCFSRWNGAYGDPVDWHLNPSRGVRWPAGVHHARVASFAETGGDIKFVWEINRFPHVFDWVRAYALMGDPTWVRAFTEQLASWQQANPFRSGANWASGQEVAIRLVCWIFAVGAMGRDDAFTDADFRRFVELVAAHADHLQAHIGHARWAVHNNHLIGEALGLLAAGHLFPTLPGASGWRALGLNLLVNDCSHQFYDDGGYCQSSHTYHRLALHYLLWADRIVGPDAATARALWATWMRRSARYLSAFVCETDGRLPNWGANDGALLCPWTACDYGDFRPLLSALEVASGGQRRLPEGPWDEEVFWLFGADAAASGENAAAAPSPRTFASFPTSGLHVVRASGSDFAVMRCGDVRDRFGQADQLHVDIWRDGWNVAADGGSYLYNDELAFHRWFMGTSSHNTVTVDDQDQMLLWRRFKWLYWTKAHVLSASVDGLRGVQRGYERLGVRHQRNVRWHAGAWRVEDSLTSVRRQRRATVGGTADWHTFRLHWLLDATEARLERRSATRWEVALRGGKNGEMCMTLSVEVDSPNEARPAPPGSMDAGPDVELITADAVRPEGWISRYYGERRPAFGLVVSARSAGEMRFVSSFSEVASEVEAT